MILKFITANISSGVTDIVVKCTKANINDYVDIKKAFYTHTDYDSKFSLFLKEFVRLITYIVVPTIVKTYKLGLHSLKLKYALLLLLCL